MKLLFFKCLNEVHRLNFVACRKKKMLWLKEYKHYHDISQILFLICIFTIYWDHPPSLFIIYNVTIFWSFWPFVVPHFNCNEFEGFWHKIKHFISIMSQCYGNITISRDNCVSSDKNVLSICNVTERIPWIPTVKHMSFLNIHTLNIYTFKNVCIEN